MDTKSDHISIHYETVNDVNFGYDKTGCGKSIILLLPGALGTPKTMMLPQMEHMNKDKFTIIGFHPRGYGSSRPPERDWPLDFLSRDAEDAAALMKRLNINQYSVMGWCEGGAVAIILAATNPDVVHKLVVWGCHSSLTQREIDFYLSIRDITKWRPWIVEFMQEVYSTDGFQKIWHDWITATSRYLYERNGNVCEDCLKEIQCGTLILHGTGDKFISEHHPLHLNRQIKNSRLVYMDGPHYFHRVLYENFNNHVEEFLLE